MTPFLVLVRFGGCGLTGPPRPGLMGRDWVASAEIQMNDCANELSAYWQKDSTRDKY